MESIVTDAGDWAFNATGYEYWDSLESWAPIPEAERDTRAVIQAAGDAYFNRFAVRLFDFSILERYAN